MSFTTYYALADLGVRTAATKYIAQFDAVDDRESVNKVAVTSLSMCALLPPMPAACSYATAS